MLAPSGTFGVVAGLALLAAPAFASTYAGGVDMQAACAEQYPGQSSEAILNGNNAYSWFCFETGSLALLGSINVNIYCSQTYGLNCYADAQGGGPYDWGCYCP